MKKWIILIVILIVIFSVYMFSKNYNQEASSIDFIMGTVVTQNIYGVEARGLTIDIKESIMNIENNTISWRKSDSEIYGINNYAQVNKEYPISENLYTYLYKAKEIATYSEGALEPTIRPLIELWGIEGDNPRVPSDKDLIGVLANVNYNNIELRDNKSIIISKGTQIDLGAVGKGIACDKALEILENSEATGAVIAVGGSILTYGHKPNGEWKVAIRDPKGDENSVLGILNLDGTNFISTSGVYEKYFIEDDITYHHILDSKTGYPSDTGLLSVTIVCDDGLYSDGLSTACMVLGMEKSMELLDKYNAEAIFVTKDREVYITNGLKSIFTIKASGYEVKE